MGLLVIKELIGSPQAIHLHVLQLPKDRVALQALPFPRSKRMREDGANQSGQPSSPPASWRIPPLGPHRSLPQHLPVHQTAPAQKIVGCHPAMCTPLDRLGNTSLPSPSASQSPSQVHNSYN